VRARFLADADLDLRIVTNIKKVEPEIDFETAQTAALKGIPDLVSITRFKPTAFSWT
jgi:hypothetical protein